MTNPIYFRRMAMNASIELIKNMPAAMQAKKWLVMASVCPNAKRDDLESWGTLSRKAQECLKNKQRALARAAREGRWRDFDMIDVSDQEHVFCEMAVVIDEAINASTKLGSTSTVANAQSDTQHSFEEPKWVSRRWSRVCNCFKIGGACPHEGKVCSFAHSVEQLASGIKKCVHGSKCYHWLRKSDCRQGERPCECLHPKETVEDLIDRLELVKELPAVCTPVCQKSPTQTSVKSVYATESEQLKNMLFDANMRLFAHEGELLEKDKLLAEKQEEIKRLRGEMHKMMKTWTAPPGQPSVPAIYTIDIAIAEAGS